MSYSSYTIHCEDHYGISNSFSKIWSVLWCSTNGVSLRFEDDHACCHSLFCHCVANIILYSNLFCLLCSWYLSRPDLTTKKRRGGKRIRRLKEVSDLFDQLECFLFRAL